MKNLRRRIVIALLLPLTAMFSAHAQSAKGTSQNRSNGNAAEVYKKAFGMLDGRTPKGMSSDELDELIQLTESGRVSPIDVDRVRELMVKAGPFLAAIEPAAGMRRSDFELDRSKGFEVLLPHLMPMRSTARLLRAQAALANVDSDWETSLSTLRSLASLSSHSSQDDILISSMVGTAISSLSLGSIDVVLDEGSLTQERAKALAEALQPYRGNDPFNYGDSTRGEFELLSASMAGKDGEAVAALVAGMGEDGAALAGMSDRDVARGLQRARGIYDRAARAFESSDPEAARSAMTELEGEAAKNPLLSVLMPMFARALEAKLRVSEEIAERLARVDAIAEGKKSALDVANASYWLRRAAAIAASMPEESQEAITVVLFAGRDADPLLLERAERMLIGAGRVIRDSIARGLACGTIDLDSPNDGDFGLSMRWLPGLRAACRILLADAKIGDSAVAADRALLVVGVCRALTRDPSVTRALTARSIADESRPLFERVAADSSTSAEIRADMARMLRALVVSEGFAMARGLEADRDRLSTGSPWGRIIDPIRRKHVARRGPEFALFLQVALAPEDQWLPLQDPTASRSTVDSKPVIRPGPLNRTDDLLPPDPTAEARRAREAVGSLRFFRAIHAVSEDDAEAKNPFKGISAVSIRSFGTDLAQAGETASKLSEIADRFER